MVSSLWLLGIMHHIYQQLELHTLIDLLAEETQKYTKAFISGNSKEVDQQRIIIDALVEEINTRKRGVPGNADQKLVQK